MRIRLIFLCSSCIWLYLVPPANGQVSQTSKQDSVLRLEADEVRLDATVVDKNGYPVTALSADDFRIYQNNQRQKILSCKYVAGDQAGRTIIFVVDDLSMNFEELHQSRLAIQKFVESQKRPGDQVAIVQTSVGIGEQQRFSSDKLYLLNAIKNLRWSAALTSSGCGYDGCRSDEEDVGIYFGSRADAQSSSAGGFNGPSDALMSSGISLEGMQIRRIQRNAFRTFGAQIATMMYCIHALRELPGRKFLLLMSSRALFRKKDFSIARWTTKTVESILRPYFSALADEAFQAAVVIHTLEMRPDARQIDVPPFDKYLPYSKKTGGVVAIDRSFFADGIGSIEKYLRGYYLLSYTPPPGTFVAEQRSFYHQIRITMKNKEHEAHYRDGFQRKAASSQIVSSVKESLMEHAISFPFLNNSLKLRLNAAYTRAAKQGYQFRSWMHLSAKDLVFVKDADAARSLSLEFGIYISNCAGGIQNSQAGQYEIKLNDEDFARIQAGGIDFETFLPVQNAGGYYVRGVVRDRISGKSGSAYQYLEVPYVKQSRLLLSSIFLLDHPEDALSIQLQNTEAYKGGLHAVRRVQKSGTSPAVRSYTPGESIEFMAIAYNAKTKDDSPPELESQITLFKDGQECFRGETERVDVRSTIGWEEIPIRKKLIFRDGMDEGDYVLQLEVTDKQTKQIQGTAVQSIGFELHRPCRQ